MTIVLCVAAGVVLRGVALPVFAAVFSVRALLADRGYTPLAGSSGIDAMPPSAAILLVLPLLLAAIAIGWMARAIAGRHLSRARAERGAVPGNAA